MSIRDIFRWRICGKCGKTFAAINNTVCAECRHKLKGEINNV